MAYTYFHSEKNLGLLHHVGILIDFLLKELNHQSLMMIITYNLLFSFVNNLYNPIISDLFTNILDPITNTY